MRTPRRELLDLHCVFVLLAMSLAYLFDSGLLSQLDDVHGESDEETGQNLHVVQSDRACFIAHQKQLHSRATVSEHSRCAVQNAFADFLSLSKIVFAENVGAQHGTCGAEQS